MAEQARRAGVIGHPIRHSRSPLIHGHWLRMHGLGGSYEAVDVEPSAAATFISSLAVNGWAGCNVTIPHKETAFATVGRRTGGAEAIGAVNTIWYENGVLCGDNTDAYGFSCNLDDFAPGWDSGRKAAVIGAGGAARAIVHALASRGFNSIDIVNRTVARAEEVAARFGDAVNAGGWDKLPHALACADLVVNTTSLGMEGEGAMDIDLEPVPAHAIITDIVYVPLVTPFLQAARARDLKIVEGLGMLLHQAVPGFERWFGLRPEVTPELRALVVADMEKH